MKYIVLFLDVDGILNQYDISSRIRRKRTKGYSNIFNPFKKKVQRLSKLVKKYNMDVYLFSAWTEDKLKEFIHFELKGNTFKWAKNVNKIFKDYKHGIIIDDEISEIDNPKRIETDKDRYQKNKKIIRYQPLYNFGLVKDDFQKLNRILKRMQ